MLDRQRRQLIVSALRRTGFLSVRDAQGVLGVSAATVRRDFGRLVEEGAATRLHGGIELATAAESEPGGSAPATTRGDVEPPLVSLPLDARTAVRHEAKRRIAARAALMVGDGQTLFIDGGSTTLELARCLRDRDVRVVTNSFAVASELVGSRATVVVTGGTVDPESRVVIGLLADEVVVRYSAHLFFMGAVGIDRLGITNSDDRLVRTERAMMAHSDRTVVLADSSKFGSRGDARVCGLAEVAVLITDTGLPEPFRALTNGTATELIIV